MKYFLSILFLCLSCEASQSMHALLIEKKEPANAVCYLKMDPFTVGIAIEVPYKDVQFLFNDTNISETMPNIWIAFNGDKVSHILFGDKKVKGDVLNQKFIEKIIKLKGILEAKVS